jgi:segregation and condensation protein B
MSLKAKLEAVIYAAEEPVTLGQLASLFAAEALEYKAEQAAEAAKQASEAAAQAAAAQAAGPQTVDTMPLLAEGLEYLGLEQTPAFYAVAPPEATPSEMEQYDAADSATDSSAGASTDSSTEPASTPTDGELPAAEALPASPADAEGEAKRIARQRDREVKAILRQLIDELIAAYASDDRGVEIREIAGGYRVATKPECHDAVRLFIKSLKPALKLSLPALETLAVIAYKQPVTAPEVNEIRGVDSSGVFGSLLARKLITTAGRKPVIGRPILYKTTKEFLLRFGLKDVAELPSMEEFEKMAAMELDETAEDEMGAESGPDAGPELDENASEEPETDAAAASATEAAAEPAGTSDSSASAEAAPGEPPATKQAETETTPHD